MPRAATTLHITNAFHPTSGGIRTFYRAMLSAANEHQRRMTLVVPAAESRQEDVGGYGRIYHVRARRAPAFDRSYRLMLPDAYLPVSRGALIRILEQEQADLVEICDKYCVFYLAAMLRKQWAPRVRRPVLVGASFERMDDTLRAYVSPSRLGARFARWYVRHIYGPPFDYHIANSEYTATELREALWDRAADFIRVRPMGVHAGEFGPQHRDEALRRQLLEQCGGDAGSTLLVYIGRLAPEKNIALLIDALSLLARPSDHRDAPSRDHRLVIVGDGPARRSLERRAAVVAPGRVLFAGAAQGEQLRRCYASADLFVHPNAREPFGIAPLEAMASAVPVVVPDAGGVTSYATPENATLAPPEPAGFARAIETALATPALARLGAARQTAERHDWARVTCDWFETYDWLVAGFRGRTTALATDVPGRSR